MNRMVVKKECLEKMKKMKTKIVTIELEVDETQYTDATVASGIHNDLETIGWTGINSIVCHDKYRPVKEHRDITGGKEGIGL